MGLSTEKKYRTLLYVNTFVIVVLGAVMAGGCIFLLFPANLGQDYHSSLATVQAIRKVLFWRVLLVYAVVFLFMLLSIVMLHLFYSHRIAGPTYRIAAEAAKIARGNLTCKFTLRSNDNLTDIKDLLNKLGCSYRERIDAMQDRLAVVETHAEAIAALNRQCQPDDAALRHPLAELTATLKEIEHDLLVIKT